MQLKSGLTLPNGQKHQKMCVCKSNHSIYEKTMIFQVLSICISRMRRTNTCIHKLYVENWSEAAINTRNTKMYNFVILIFWGEGGIQISSLDKMQGEKVLKFYRGVYSSKCSCNIDDKKNHFQFEWGFLFTILAQFLNFWQVSLKLMALFYYFMIS